MPCMNLIVIVLLCVLCHATSRKSKTVSGKCISKVQRDMDCVLEQGQWVDGKFEDFKFLTVLQKSDWESCNRPMMNYVWKPPSSCSKIRLKPAYNREEMCEIVGGKTIMIVGDSINNQFFVTLASALWPAEVKEPVDEDFIHYDKTTLYDANGKVTCEFKFDEVVIFMSHHFRFLAAIYKDTGYNNVKMVIPCEDRKRSINLVFVRNFNLSTNTEVPDFYYSFNGQVYRDVPRQWIDTVGREKVDYLVMNRGAHFSNSIVKEVEIAFTELAERYPKLMVIWRNTPMGHAGCGTMFQNPPLTQPLDESIQNTANPDFHWNTFSRFNVRIRALIEKKFPQVCCTDRSITTSLIAFYVFGGNRFCT